MIDETTSTDVPVADDDDASEVDDSGEAAGQVVHDDEVSFLEGLRADAVTPARRQLLDRKIREARRRR